MCKGGMLQIPIQKKLSKFSLCAQTYTITSIRKNSSSTTDDSQNKFSTKQWFELTTIEPTSANRMFELNFANKLHNIDIEY